MVMMMMIRNKQTNKEKNDREEKRRETEDERNVQRCFCSHSLARRSSLLFSRLTLLSLASFSFTPFDGETLRANPLDVDANGTVDETNGVTLRGVAVVVVGLLVVGANLTEETSLLMNGI